MDFVYSGKAELARNAAFLKEGKVYRTLNF